MYPSMKLNATEWYPPAKCHDPDCTQEHLTTRSGTMPFEGCHKQLYVQTDTMEIRFFPSPVIRVLHFSGREAITTTFLVPIPLLFDCSSRANRRIEVLQEALRAPLLSTLIAIIGGYLQSTLEDEIMNDSLEVFNSVNQSNCVSANKNDQGINSKWGMFALDSSSHSFLTKEVGSSPFSQLVEILHQNRNTQADENHLQPHQKDVRAIRGLMNLYPRRDANTGCTIL